MISNFCNLLNSSNKKPAKKNFNTIGSNSHMLNGHQKLFNHFTQFDKQFTLIHIFKDSKV